MKLSIYEQQQRRKAATEARVLAEPQVHWDAATFRAQYNRNAEYGKPKPIAKRK